MDRSTHVTTEGANFTDIDRVFDSELPQTGNIRVNPNENGIFIPKNMMGNFRFKQLDPKGKTKVLTHLDSVAKKLQGSKELTVQLAKDLLEADYDVWVALNKDAAVLKELDDMKVDYRKIRENNKNDEFDLDDKKGKPQSNIPDDVKNLEMKTTDENDELKELVDDFGI